MTSNSIDYVTMMGAIISVLSFIASFVYNRFFNAEQKAKFDELVEKMNDISQNILHPASVQNTPIAAEPYDDNVLEDEYIELKPYYNKRTGKTEMLIEVPQSARRPNTVPAININN
jgi:hypothetical protein